MSRLNVGDYVRIIVEPEAITKWVYQIIKMEKYWGWCGDMNNFNRNVDSTWCTLIRIVEGELFHRFSTSLLLEEDQFKILEQLNEASRSENPIVVLESLHAVGDLKVGGRSETIHA